MQSDIVSLVKTEEQFHNHEKNSENNKNILNTSNLSLDIVIPNKNVFQMKSEYSNTIRVIKSNHKVKTNELFYGNGLLNNLYNLTNCDYNWLLSYIVCDHNKSKFNDDIKTFHIGFGNGGIVLGMKYYLANCLNKSFNDNIDWLGINKSITEFALDNSENVIYDMDIGNVLLSDIYYIKNSIENQFDKVDYITNNIKPTIKKNKILINIAVLSVSVLQADGIVLTRIINPEYWGDYFLHYILLFSLLFNSIEIFRFPIYKKKHVRYRYYLLCKNKKRILYESMIYRKLLFLSTNTDIQQLIFLPDIFNIMEINEWKEKLLTTQSAFINNVENPQDALINIINKINYSLSQCPS
jgi:hypothetical protein